MGGSGNTCKPAISDIVIFNLQAADNNGITNSKSTVTRKLSPCFAAQDILAFTVATEGEPFVVGVVNQQNLKRRRGPQDSPACRQRSSSCTSPYGNSTSLSFFWRS